MELARLAATGAVTLDGLAVAGERFAAAGDLYHACLCHSLQVREQPLAPVHHRRLGELYAKMGYAAFAAWHHAEAERLSFRGLTAV